MTGSGVPEFIRLAGFLPRLIFSFALFCSLACCKDRLHFKVGYVRLRGKCLGSYSHDKQPQPQFRSRVEVHGHVPLLAIVKSATVSAERSSDDLAERLEANSLRFGDRSILSRVW